MANCDVGSKNTSRLVILDNKSNLRFLIDTGADISVLPPSPSDRLKNKSVFNLIAANGSHICTYGKKRITVSLGLCREFSWVFTIADVSRPIIGSDFLSNFNILVDIRGRALIDKTTQIKTNGKLFKDSSSSVTTIIGENNRFHHLIQSYSDIMNLNSLSNPITK